ncbi:MAG: glycosyltransferase [Ginsengibacter sp.]
MIGNLFIIIKRPVIFIADKSSSNYFHWTTEALPRLLASDDLLKKYTVILPGLLSSAEVSKYRRKSRAFVQHSLHTSDGDSEVRPVAILEAMACGLPVISTNHNGTNDTI